MGFLKLLEVASAPVIQVLVISALGAFMASSYCGMIKPLLAKFSNYGNNLLSPDFRKSLNKVVFVAFTPALIFTSVANNVSLKDMISWWFMPVNIGLTFLIGGILGWIIVKLLKPSLKLEGLITAACSTGNMGNLPIVIIRAIRDEEGGPFGAADACRVRALSYSSFSLAVGGIFIWTYTFQMIQNSSIKYRTHIVAEIFKVPNRNLDTNTETGLLKGTENEDTEKQIIVDQSSPSVLKKAEEPFWHIMVETLSQILAELMSPPTIATILGFLFGGVTWLRNLILGDNAPLHVIEDSIQLLGNGTISCITILLGGNLTQGMVSSCVKPLTLISIIIARFFLLPAIGLFVVKFAANFGFLPLDPLYRYVLVMQYAMPPAMNISTMAQLFDVGTEEASVILLWTYGAAIIALTAWSTFLLWVLS